MKRKLVKQGAATMMISLPAKWIKEFSLKKGDEIDLIEVKDNLVISKEGVEERKKTEITLTKDKAGIRTLITNAYRSGYDIIKVNYINESQLEVIRNALRNYLLGYDITKKKKGFCIIENITEPSPQQFDALINKIFFNIKELISLTKKRLEGKKVLEDFREITLRIHQYDSFCRRVVAKRQKEVKDPTLFWTFQTLIVHGQRDLYHLNYFLDKNPVKASKETLSLLDSLLELFNILVNGYIRKETSHLEKAHEMESNLIYDKAYSIISSKKGKECVVLHRIMDSIRNFYLAASPLMGLLL